MVEAGGFAVPEQPMGPDQMAVVDAATRVIDNVYDQVDHEVRTSPSVHPDDNSERLKQDYPGAPHGTPMSPYVGSSYPSPRNNAAPKTQESSKKWILVAAAVAVYGLGHIMGRRK